MSARLPVEVRVAILSAATRDAIEASGGLENAARVTRAGRSQLSRCQCAHEDDTLSTRDALALDDVTLGRGGPHILRAYAGLLNHIVIPMPAAPDDPHDIAAQVMRIGAELGDLSRAVADALADGAVDRREAVHGLDQIDDLMTAASALRATFFGIAYPEGIGA